MTNTPNSKQKFINICSGWSEVDYWGTENSGKRASFNNWPSGDDNEQTSSSDSGLWTTNSSCSSVDFSFLKEDLSLMKKEVLLTHEEALLINEFCEKMVSVGKKNEQEYKNEFCRGIKSEQEYKGKSNQKKNWTEGALGNIKNLVDEYLGRGIKLDSYCNDNKETVVDLIFQEIIGILESTTNITSGSEALGFGSLGYDEDEAIKIENITIIQSVVCQLLLRGGRVKRHLFYHDRIAHATTSFMGNDPYKHLDQYISNEYEEIKEQLKNIVCVSIVNKGNQAQEYVLAVEIDNEHFYVKCAQDSIIEPAKITNNIGSICSNTRDKVEEVVGDQESKIRQRIEDLKTEGQKIAALETEGQETVDLKTLAHKITDLKISAYKIAGLENTDQETADLETLAYKIANLKKVADSKGKDQRIKEIECLERLSHKIENLKTEGQKTEGLEILAHKIADLKTKSQKTEDLEVLAHKIADLKMLVHEIADLEALACKIADHNIAAQNLKVCILQIGKNTIGFECTEEKRNYIDLADDSDIVLTFYTSQRELEVRLYPDKQNKNLIRVEVEDQEMWEELKDCNEEIGKNCSLGGYSVHDAIEQGHFKRSGKLCQSSEIVSSSAKTVNKKQQLLQNLRNIESNIVKKEKNFDIKTHLVEIFKTLSRFCEEKGDISKTDLAKAAEKESKKLGLEGKYNWSKIFGLEKGVIEKAEKQGDKEQKSNIPDNFYVKQAIADGNCFFYSFRQGLEQQLGIRATVEQLRQYCKEFAQKNPPEWFINAIANSHDNNGAVRRETPDFYTKNILNNNRWGDPEVEGRILCGKYGVKLHVVEGNPLHATDEQQDPSLHQLIDSSGSRNAGEYNRIDYNDNNVIHIVNKGHDHFEPLLNRNKILAKCYSSSPRCSMDELKIESHRHKVLLVSGS